ncbi:hypothetical protein F5J12DRAFT_915786 [Pisolithus orientalis]|uniref:uncharacterized protein n=1 Tax=Pisolithus orientalis TaxID=936130 RepID=UPI0022258CEF|nr:uncharacterized protein F5J12DRAFT_915786 [Pisolithus orientalis]KAI5989812.1 hypothetical protein F5J12DRAFT_915786 [Pisolithus orientalis]
MGHRSPLIPIFAAVDLLLDDLQYHDSDLVTDENNLRELLRCIDRRHDKSFCIDLDLLGKTCLFSCLIRHEEASIKEFRGYGHECEVGATKPRRGSEDGISHHRVISYDFGGLKHRNEGSVNTNDSAYFSRFEMKVKLTSLRSVLPQSSMIEIKTRAARRQLDCKEVYVQLYLSQTPYFYLEKHTRGNS